MRRIVWYTAVVLGTLTVLVLLWQFRQAFVLFLLSLVVASSIYPLIDISLERGYPRWAALVLAYLPLLVVIVLVLIAVSGPLLRDLEAASNDLTIGYERLREAWMESDVLFQSSLAEQMPSSNDLFEGLRGGQRVEIFQAVLGVTGGVASFFGNLGVIIILSVYWSADRVHFERLWLSIVPMSRRVRARTAWRAIESGVGAYLRSELLQSLLAGIFLWVGFYFMGLPYPMLLAVFGAVAWLVPWLGGIIALVPPLLVGLSQSLLLGLSAASFVLLVLLFLEFVIQPRFFQRQRYSSLLLLVVAFIFADAFGLIGIILAPLVSAAIEVAFSHILQPYLRPAADEQESAELKEELSVLKSRLDHISQTCQQLDDQPSPEVLSLVARLDALVARVQGYLGSQYTPQDGPEY